MKDKKYNYQLLQDKSGWTANIVRRKTTKESIISKSQNGFASEAAAREWSENELKSFSKNQIERNKRRSKPAQRPTTKNTNLSNIIANTKE